MFGKQQVRRACDRLCRAEARSRAEAIRARALFRAAQFGPRI